jgi:hypothetical protein
MSDTPMQPLADHLGRAVTLEEFDAAAKGALRAFDALGEGIISANDVKLACRAGCSLCCSLRVDVFAHEVFLLAHHIWTHLSAEEVAALGARLKARGDKVRALTPFEHAQTNIPCAMLLPNGFCGVYEARPHSCRRHHSQDLATCQYTYDHSTDLDSPAAHDRALFRALTEAMLQGVNEYARLGFDYTIYELGTALEEALTDPTCWARWRHGEQAFHYASITPAE